MILSIVVPVYNESLIINEMQKRLVGVCGLLGVDYELIFIDDGSKDDTWLKIIAAHSGNPCIKGVRFTRNFGKEQAVFAGLSCVKGNVIVVIDGDLQHPPELIKEMFEMWLKGGVDIVRGIKRSRGVESFFYRGASSFFYQIIKRYSGLELKNSSDFLLMDKRVVNALSNFSEKSLFLRGLIAWIGFRQKEIEFDVDVRYAGQSKWNATSLIRYALANLLSFSSKPLKLVNSIAILFFIFSCILSLFSVLRYFNGSALEGFTTMIIVVLMVGCAIMFGLGVVAEYVGQIYEEIKSRPRYLVMEELI